MKMSDLLDQAIKSVRENQFSFTKFISPNDAGETGAHQAGLYIPKNSFKLLFDEPGEKGSNKEKFVNLSWYEGSVSECRFIYYGQGTRNEYRITRLGRTFAVGEFVVIVKKTEDQYEGFVFGRGNEGINLFLEEFNLNEEDTNSLINKDNNTFELSFKPKAHILILLGEELIKSPVMAIYELIKNGYDADATIVDVTFKNIESLDNATISVQDTGTGITEETLRNVWFEPGTDFRKPINEEGVRQIKRSHVYKRIPMGEKGIGRFAVHKLGNRIRMISRPAVPRLGKDEKFAGLDLLNYELVIDIDWRRFSQSKYLEDVSIKWKKRENPESFRFKKNSGTFIEISDLKEEWTRGMARQLKRQTISMLSPKNDPSKFKINLDFGNSWLDNFPETEQILEKSPYKLTALIDSDYNLTFEYYFSLANNPSIGTRIINEKIKDNIDKTKYNRNIKGELKQFFRSFLRVKQYEQEKAEELIDVFEKQKLPYGSLMLELYSFDLDSASLKDTLGSPSLVKELLRDHAGIKVFKGDLRVYDYGDPGNDWLGLDLKRIQNKEWFSNNQNIGYVYLDSASSSSLIEKTNREGFIENYAFDHFRLLLDFLLSEFKAERQNDREKWLKYNKKGPTSTLENRISGFREIVENADLSNDEKKQQILEEAEKIEQQYEQDKSTLLIPASVGMTASFAMHEIEKLVPRMQETVSADPVNKLKITDQVFELKDYVDGILSVMKKGSNKPVLIREAINQALNNYTSRLKHRNVHIESHYDPNAETIICDKRLLITMLMNLIDNSIYWLDTIYKPNKSIYFSTKRKGKSVSLLVVDNGPGFRDKVEDLVRPFFSRKEGGIGIGLYLLDTVMIQYGRLNIIYDKELLAEQNVPPFYDGAAVELIFNKY
jgi:signal transduction histidine kinase